MASNKLKVTKASQGVSAAASKAISPQLGEMLHLPIKREADQETWMKVKVGYGKRR